MKFEFQPPQWHDSLPSTNTWLAECFKTNPETPPGSVVAAREQTAGRGRQHRRWSTEPGRNLTFSFLWRHPVPTEHLPSMAQAISVGIARLLADRGIAPTIKWPNDVLVSGKKISGILCETVSGGPSGNPVVVAGVGLNINMSAEAAQAIDQPATSMALETGCFVEPADVLDELLQRLAAPLNLWSASGFGGIAESYSAFTVPPGTELRVRDGERYAEGRLAGFNAHGALRLTLNDGSEQTFYSGDLALG